jgi:membrane protein YdbS with pleckstrin-like domain
MARDAEGKMPFSLQKGETVLKKIKPQKKGFILSRTLNYAVPVIIVYAALGFAISVTSVSDQLVSYGSLWLTAAVISVVLLAVLLVGAAYASVAYKKYDYWVTNYRVIGERGGMLFSKTDSIPLEDVNDVTLKAGIMGHILNVRTLRVIPILGQPVVLSSWTRRWVTLVMSDSNYFPALPPELAVELRSKILDLSRTRKKQLSKRA